MRFPKQRPIPRRRVMLEGFRGYDHRPGIPAGSFYAMENCSGEDSPLVSVRRRREPTGFLEGCPTHRVLAMGGRGRAVVLDAAGTLWCRGRALPRLLDCSWTLSCRDDLGRQVEAAEQNTLLEALPTAGEYRYQWSGSQWETRDGGDPLPAGLFPQVSPGETAFLLVTCAVELTHTWDRQLVFLGGWVCVFPDGRYANVTRLAQGQEMTEGEDYGPIDRENVCQEAGTLFQPCGADGTVWEVHWSDQAPASGYWVDTSEPEPKVRAWSQGQGLWMEVSPYVKCSLPGIAKGVSPGDAVELFTRLNTSQGGEQEVENLWSGTQLLVDAWHDPGDSHRPEGRGDYVILRGMLSDSFEIEITLHDRSFFTLKRSLPEMDFVVECQNRLWGCRYSGGVNELYGCKLGDFRNWNVFEGLSTDSYRVSRGQDGPYTGAAVLGGCPLFFRSDSLEKIYPSAAGDHGVVTLSLSGIQPGCAKSAVVIRDRLYYKALEGICRYDGTLPVRVSQALGREPYDRAVAGARGSLYYVSMTDADGIPNLFVLDTDTGCWYREDRTVFYSTYSREDKLYFLPAAGEKLVCVGSARDSRGVHWSLETGDLGPALGTKRYMTRLQLTASLDYGSELRVSVSYDGGPWLDKGQFQGNDLRSLTLPIYPHRCDRLRLRLEGQGGMRLHRITWLTEAGSDE